MMSMYNIFMNSSSLSIMLMEQFHDYTMMFLSMITSFIFLIIFRITKLKNTNLNFKENINLEIIWTILPMLILFLIAYPSIYYLYLFDLSYNPSISVKVIGAQWYWIYELMEKSEKLNTDSYMILDNELMKKNVYKMGWRLLETDTRLSIPYSTEIQFIVTSYDVIHSFSIPELGLKMDAIPGRLNTTNLMILRPGLYYGQCTEICGTGHSFMPISMEAY
uniref:cytochrome oxidase subunit II n=1 Tax=Bregmatothrips sinensis TaxID=3045418 RepID=UPI0030E4B509